MYVSGPYLVVDAAVDHPLMRGRRVWRRRSFHLGRMKVDCTMEEPPADPGEAADEVVSEGGTVLYFSTGEVVLVRAGHEELEEALVAFVREWHD